MTCKKKKYCDRKIKFLEFKKGLGFSPEFWLRTIEKINHPGKVFSVLILLIEHFNQLENKDTKWTNEEKLINYSYIFSMFLGNYWYTHWWGTKEDRESFFYDFKCDEKKDCEHALSFTDPKNIVFGATLYYSLYTYLFNKIGNSSNEKKKRLKSIFKTMSLWNLLISGNLMLLLNSM